MKAKGHIIKRGNSFSLKLYIGRDPLTGKERSKWHTLKARNKTEAKIEAAGIVTKTSAPDYSEPEKITVGQWLDRWLEQHVAHNVSAKSAERYGEIVAGRLKPALGNHPLAKLRPLHIQAFLSALLTEGKISPLTARHCLRVLSNSLTRAEQLQMIASNPCRAITAPRVERKEMKILDIEQSARLMQAAWASPNPLMGIVVSLALYTGMRRGEVLALQWKNVDLDRARLSVAQTLEQTKSGLRFKQPKTLKSRRVISLSPQVIEALKRHKAGQSEMRLRLGPDYADNDLVVAQWNGAPVSPRNVTKAFMSLVRSCGPVVRLHDLRHSHASHLLLAGVNAKVVSERLGHSSIAITMDVYSHVMPGMQEDAAAKIGGLFLIRGDKE